ncbi:o-succinylbenzoate synthase [Algoriphagus halophytocola]|uniref:O-succinylbenzoate synthase n=1 Tax=Algoriphagus halophytocola TaxID=2991499 RepID=A0ABY6MIH9_9BACT|nr:o-succinylbenzoate synthase [Algoriphagus sp. TR-M5]UZD22993.1 o-succinylbenzoate synthase [Algoriphagus sp. TR-M5]
MSDYSRIHFQYIKRNLKFKFDAGTSRGVLREKEVFWIKAFFPGKPEVSGWGEAAPLVKLSPDDRPDFEAVLKSTLEQMSRELWDMEEGELLKQVGERISFKLPSIRFGVETAVLDLLNGGKKCILENEFYQKNTPIAINGLIWMGDKGFMLSQIESKLAQGFSCIKMKIGAIDFQQELDLLGYIRARFSEDEIILRVDANGAFLPANALSKLQQLAQFGIHSIEQPIRAGQEELMRKLCQESPLPIALDEELIGVQDKATLLDKIQPPYIILKPTLLGGIAETKQWIAEAESRNIDWWMTSALESNIGLNAIAQLASNHHTAIPQGLGTGQLYHNNLASPLTITEGHLRYDLSQNWEDPA